MGLLDVLKDLLIKFFEWIWNLSSAKRDRRKLFQELGEYVVKFESNNDGTIVADGIFHQCLRSHRTIEKIVNYVWDAPETREREDCFLARLHSEMIRWLRDRTTKPLTGLDAHTVHVFLEEILNYVKGSLAKKTPSDHREMRYQLQQTEATGARIEEEINCLIRKVSEYQTRECNVTCDIYRSVKISVKLPTLENARYYLQYVRAGKDDWDHKGALENLRYPMKQEADGIFSVSLEKVPVNLGFQFKCYAQCETERGADAVYQTLREYLFPLYRSSRFPEYQNGKVYVNNADGAKSEFVLVSCPSREKKVWFILPEYYPYITGDKQHSFLNNYCHCIEELG